MPPVIPFIIPLVIAGATAAETIYSAVNQPGQPKAIDPTKQPLTAAQNRQEQSAVSQALPDLQSLTGGSLSPEYAAQFGALQSGLGNDPKAAGNVQAAINQFFGLAAPGKMGLSPESASTGGGGIWDFIKDILPRLSGQQAQAQPGLDFASQTLQGNDFKGLAG